MPPASPGEVALILSVMHLAVLGKVGGQTERGVGVGGVRERNVWRTGQYPRNRTLRERLTAGELEEACAVADADLLDEVRGPGASVVPAVLAVLCRNGDE